MAFENERSITLRSIQKNNRGDHIIVTKIDDVSTEEFKGVDIRQYYTGDDDELHPTKKGIRIPADKLDDVLKALNPISENHKDMIEVLNQWKKNSEVVNIDTVIDLIENRF